MTTWLCQDDKLFLLMLVPQAQTQKPLVCCRVQSLVTDMADWLCGGDVIYMHCMGGIGRTGTMCACILISLYNMPAEQALAHVQAAFDTRRRGESSAQAPACLALAVSHV